MTFNDYQYSALKTAKSMNKEDKLQLAIYTLGLSGETGEVLERVKEFLRQDSGLTKSEFKVELTKELGDVLWHISTLAAWFEISLDNVAALNANKLRSRLLAGVSYLHKDKPRVL